MRKLWMIVAAALVAFGTAAARADSMIGSTVGVQYLYPNTSSVLVNDGSTTVSNGTSFNFPNLVNVTFGTNTITVTDLTPGAFSTASFNGVEISFLSGFNVGGVTIDSASSSTFATGADLNFTNSNIFLNFSGTCGQCVGGESIVLDVTGTAPATATPEPGSLALLGTGVLGFAGVLNRRLRLS